MANGILPTLPVVPIVRKILGEKMGEIKNKMSLYIALLKINIDTKLN